MYHGCQVVGLGFGMLYAVEDGGSWILADDEGWEAVCHMPVPNIDREEDVIDGEEEFEGQTSDCEDDMEPVA